MLEVVTVAAKRFEVVIGKRKLGMLFEVLDVVHGCRLADFVISFAALTLEVVSAQNIFALSLPLFAKIKPVCLYKLNDLLRSHFPAPYPARTLCHAL